MDYEDYSDDYVSSDIDGYEAYQYYFDEHSESESILNSCVKPVLSDTFSQLLLPTLFFNICLKCCFVCQFVYSNSYDINYRVPTILCGIIFIFYNFSTNTFLSCYLLLCIVIAALFLAFKLFNHKVYLWSYCILIIIVNESTAYIVDIGFVKLRPLLMMIVMKIVSFSSLEFEKHKISDDKFSIFVECLTYLLHPQGLPTGAYHPFMKPSLRLTLSNCLQSLKAMFSALFFVLFSTCFVQNFAIVWFSELITFSMHIFPLAFCEFIEKYTLVYFTALQFRTSHYFICFLMQSMHQFWNQDLIVTKPSMIEFPRSLVDVVVAWNIPMHVWLKKHVFEKSRLKFGNLTSIIFTYFISSFLHGLNFQIWSVLLSLGILTWTEFSIRRKLAHIYNACIDVRKCHLSDVSDSHNTRRNWLFSRNTDTRCDRHEKNINNSLFTRMTTLAFSVLAIIHLAFLGSSFDGKEGAWNFTRVIDTWTDLNFYSLLIGFLTIIIYKIIE